ncbi:hypothetical protein E4U38_001080, partial [Claviceps purpurea]
NAGHCPSSIAKTTKTGTPSQDCNREQGRDHRPAVYQARVCLDRARRRCRQHDTYSIGRRGIGCRSIGGHSIGRSRNGRSDQSLRKIGRSWNIERKEEGTHANAECLSIMV